MTREVDAEKEAAIERERVEQVFGLTGGELADEPWVYWTQSESEVDGKPLFGKSKPDHADWFMEWRHRYWYEGTPEYAQRELENKHGFYSSMRTLVEPGGMLSAPHRELYDGDGVWELVETFVSSGEAPCPNRDGNRSIVGEENTEDGYHRIAEDECPLCEEKQGEEHGYIYLGDGGYEAVYVLREQHRWEVVVGNVGTVYSGMDEEKARQVFVDYLDISENNDGSRGFAEDVVLLKAGEIEQEHEGRTGS